MIDEARTIELFGYTSDSLTHGSSKKIVAVCDECGRVRIPTRQKYRDLCSVCVRKGRTPTDETRRKLSDAHKGKKHYLYGRTLPDETRRKISDAHKGKKLSDEHKRKISNALKGANASGWKGGISFEPYCQKFNEAFKESIREKFGRVCFLCPKTESENGRKLSVHHVDYDKNCLCDGVNCEFVPLCIACHSKTNHNREYWENLIMEKLKTETFNNYGG